MMLFALRGCDLLPLQGTLLSKEQELQSNLFHTKLELLRCALHILPAINWSMHNWAIDPLLSELKLNGLMLAEAYLCMYQYLSYE